MKKLSSFSAYYLQIVGIAIAASWIFILSFGAIEEGKLEFGFHLFSECILSLLCFLAGMMQRRRYPHGQTLALAAHAMLIYALLNAAGYYAQLGQFMPAGLFLLMFLLSVFLLFHLLSDH